jgi:hypothetical protein
MARFSRIKWRFPLESRFGGSMIVSTYKLAQDCFSIFLGQIRAAGQDGAGGLCVPPLAPSRWTSLYGEYERLVNGSDPGKTQ